jgi:hypothetical protein
MRLTLKANLIAWAWRPTWLAQDAWDPKQVGSASEAIKSAPLQAPAGQDKGQGLPFWHVTVQALMQEPFRSGQGPCRKGPGLTGKDLGSRLQAYRQGTWLQAYRQGTWAHGQGFRPSDPAHHIGFVLNHHLLSERPNGYLLNPRAPKRTPKNQIRPRR